MQLKRAWPITGADLGFLKGGLFFGKALVLEARGPRGHVPPRFLKRGHRGAPCYEEMYLDLSITSDENAMLSGSDGQNYQSGGGAFVGQGGAPI